MPKAKPLSTVAFQLPTALSDAVQKLLPARVRQKIRPQHAGVIGQACLDCAAQVMLAVEKAVSDAETKNDKQLDAFVASKAPTP